MNKQETYLKARQVAKILGVSLPQVYAKARAGVWPSHQIDGMRGVRFKEEEILSLMSNNLDTVEHLRVFVPKLSGGEVKEHVKGLQAGRNVVDRFLCGRP